MKNALIVDFSNLAARAFWAVNLKTSDGRHSGLVYGMLRMLFNKIQGLNITSVYICMDRKPYWRNLVFPEYKKGRRKSQDLMGDYYDDYIEQLEDMNRLLPALGFYCLAYKGMEADDIAAAFVFKFKDQYDNLYTYSGDHDWFQLVGGKVKHIQPKIKSDDIIISENNFSEIVGVKDTNTFLDILCFAGDHGDAIPSIFATRNGTEEEGYYWEEPARVISESKIKKILASPYNETKNLLEGKINPVKGIGPKTEILFSKISDIQRERFKINKKLINLQNGKEKLEALRELKNEFEIPKHNENMLAHIIQKYELSSVRITKDFPYYYINIGKYKEKPVINKSKFMNLLKESREWRL